MKFLMICLVVLGSLYYWPIENIDIEKHTKDTIKVYVQGEVKENLSIELEKYSTLEKLLDCVEFTEYADIENLNPLMVLKDQDVIVIPRKSEIVKISINYATFEELLQIPGIGESKALKIIDYRNTFGLFQTLEDLMKIQGIKQKTFDKLKEYICL